MSQQGIVAVLQMNLSGNEEPASLGLLRSLTVLDGNLASQEAWNSLDLGGKRGTVVEINQLLKQKDLPEQVARDLNVLLYRAIEWRWW